MEEKQRGKVGGWVGKRWKNIGVQRNHIGALFWKLVSATALHSHASLVLDWHCAECVLSNAQWSLKKIKFKELNFNQVSPGSCETRRGNSTLMWGVKRQIHWASPFTGDLTKFGRGDASSPAPATTLAQPQQNQTQTHHTTQQTFLNPALPPGYSYTSLPYYTGVPGLPSTFQYGPAVFPVSAWTWSCSEESSTLS